MNKEQTPLEALKDLREVKGWNDKEFNERLDLIENALKRLEEQDDVLKILKEVIEFARVLPHIKPNKDNGFDIMSAVSINIRRDIENKERELLRKWVLETCFPKELKALEIIKESQILLIDEDEMRLKGVGGVFTTKEEYNLLKEVLV